MAAVRENLAHLHPIHPAPVRVADCVATAVRSADLPDGMRVQLEGLDDLPRVVAGQQSLTLVFTNLLENAAEAMKGDGVVSIQGTAQKSWVDLLISDDGPGIPPEMRDRIFEFELSGRRPAHAGKLGFGLWWVRTLMVRLGGSITVEHSGQQGTTFRLRLPRAEGGA
jgi:signal transduction histidine kinase